MIKKYTSGSLVWIDLNSPTSDEIRQVVAEYKIHPAAAHELNIPTLRPKVDIYENFIYLILHFPALHKDHDGNKNDQEVDFIIGRNFLITARYEEVDALLAFSKAFEVEMILEKGAIGKHAGFVFYAMVNRVYESVLNKIEVIKDNISEVEKGVFKGKERDMVARLSYISRDLLDLKRSTSLHREILESFEMAAVKFFGEEFRFHVRAMTGDCVKVENAIKNALESVAELRETNNALLTTKQNQIIQVLTVIAFIALPLSVVSSLFQVETKARPIVGGDYDFWIIGGVEAVLALLLFVYFKTKKWL